MVGITRCSAILACSAALALPYLASADIAAGGGPPYITDDPEPVDLNHYEFYISSYYFHNGFGTSGTMPHFEFNYGAAPNLQLHVIAPLAFDQASDSTFNYGYGATEFGAKYRFVQEGKTMPMIGVFPLVEAPTGNASRGLSSSQTQFFLPVWLQKSLGNWSSYGGGGYWINPGVGNQNYWFFGWQVQNQVTKQLSIGAELFHSTGMPTVDGSAQSGFNIGAVYDIDDGHHVMFSVGRGFEHDNVGTAYLAYQWTFGPHEKGKG
jgi:hypothetical protein